MIALRISEGLSQWVREGRYKNDRETMDKTADYIHVSKSQLAWYFNTEVGTSFTAWRKTRRIECAKQLLVNRPDLSASRIGEMCGIPDRSNFRKQFIEETGMTPGEWRSKKI